MSTTTAATHKPHVVTQATPQPHHAPKPVKSAPLKPLRTTATTQASDGAKPAPKRHVTAAKQATAGEQLIKPVNGPITAHVGDMASYRGGRHTGTDFGVGVGTPVHAAATGKVVSAKSDGAFGNEIILQHGPKRFTEYAHLSAFAAGLSVGDTVKQGQVIGKSGATGNVTGPHLHFEVRDQAGFDRMNPNDPEQEFGRSMADLGAGKLPAIAPSAATPSSGGGPTSSSAPSAPSGGGSTSGGGGGGGGAAPSHHAHAHGGGGHHHGGGTGGGGAASSDPAATDPTATATSTSTDTADAAAATPASDAAIVPLTAADYAQLPAELAAALQQFAALTPEEQTQALTTKLAAIPTVDPSTPVTPEQQQAIDAQRAELELYLRAAAPDVAAQVVSSSGLAVEAPAEPSA
jgi:hypothetical protein